MTGCAIKVGQNCVLEWLLAQDAIDLIACCEKASTRTALHMIAAHGTLGDLATYLQSANSLSAKVSYKRIPFCTARRLLNHQPWITLTHRFWRRRIPKGGLL